MYAKYMEIATGSGGGNHKRKTRSRHAGSVHVKKPTTKRRRQRQHIGGYDNIRVRDNEEEQKENSMALLIACSQNNETLALQLIQSGIDLNVVNEHGVTALMLACFHELARVALAIIRRDRGGSGAADLTMVNQAGYSALFYACAHAPQHQPQFPPDSVALAILEADPTTLNIVFPEDRTPLMIACIFNLPTVAVRIVEMEGGGGSEADETVDASGNTAMDYAEIYMSEAAQLQLQDAILRVAAEGTLAALPPAQHGSALGFELIRAIQVGDSAAALQLIRDAPASVSLDAVTPNGQTALMLACERGMEEVALALIASDKVDITKQVDTWDALYYACVMRQPRVALALLHKKPELCEHIYHSDHAGAMGPDGWTPLMLACAYALPSVALALMEAAAASTTSADTAQRIVHHSDEQGMTALRLAIAEMLDEQPGMEQVVSALLQILIPQVTTADQVAAAITISHDLQPPAPSASGFNVAEGREQQIGEFMQQPNALCITLLPSATNSQPQSFLLEADQVAGVLTNPSAIRFECTQVVDTSAPNPAPTTIVYNPFYIALRALGIPADFVEYKMLQIAVYVAQHQQAATTNTNTLPPPYFYLRRTDKSLASTISLVALEGMSGTSEAASGVSTAHCQEGQGGYVYELVAVARSGG